MLEWLVGWMVVWLVGWMVTWMDGWLGMTSQPRLKETLDNFFGRGGRGGRWLKSIE